MLRLAPFARRAPDDAVQFDQLTVWLAPQLSTHVAPPCMVAVPSLQLHVAEPVVGSVLSIRLPVVPWLTFRTEGDVQVLPDTAHVVPEATVQLISGRVVTLQLSVTPPTFTVAVRTVLKEALEVRRTASV